MGLFKRKKQESKLETHLMYTETEKKLFFLNLILSRKKNITKEYYINVLTTQLISERDILRDDDIEPIISNLVESVVNEIGSSYKDFLIKKYFGSFENLIKFISEDIYVELTADAILRNEKKAAAILNKRALSIVNKLNSTP